MPSDPHPVVLLIGGDDYLRKKAIDDLLASLFGSVPRDFDFRMFYSGEADLDEVVSHAATLPFLSSERVTLLRDCEKLTKEERSRLSDYLKKPARSSCLILESLDDSLLAELDAAGVSVQVRRCASPRGQDLVGWIKKFFSQNGRAIDPDAVGLIAAVVSGDLLQLRQELEKVLIFAGTKEPITMQDVEAVVGQGLVKSAHDLGQAIVDAKTKTALATVHALIGEGKKPYEVTGLLTWYFKRLARARLLYARRQSDAMIIDRLKINRRYAGEFLRQVRRLRAVEIRSRMETLLEADAEIKRSKYDPGVILEIAVVRLCLGDR